MREKTSKKNPKSMTGGQSLIHCLYNEGVKVIFGLPGVQIYHAIIPILDYPDMQFITTRHEQATTYMADGYARAGGKVGVAMVAPGPGLQNASAGITNAYASSSRVLIVSGQINRNKISKDVGVLHEINDQMDATDDKVVVHCFAGMERSVLTCVWYLHRYEAMSIDYAYQVIYDKRPVILDRRHWADLDDHGSDNTVTYTLQD